MGGGSAATPASLKTIRIIVTTTDGLRSEAYLPTSTSASSTNGWKSIAVPLQAISGFDRTNKTVKEVAVSGDATTTFYLGDLRIVNDSTPISGEANLDRKNLALGDEVNFTASGTGGSSILVYTWDFDEKDGIQVDAEGQAVKRRFRTAGDYTVTLTVSDKYGLKAPFSTKLHLVVNP
jgi:PKD repeat protein